MNWDEFNLAQKALFVSIIVIFLFHIGRHSVFCLIEKLVAKKNDVEIADTPMPNFFDAIQEVDIEDYIEDFVHFTSFGFSFFRSKDKIERLKEELEERKTGLNKVSDSG